MQPNPNQSEIIGNVLLTPSTQKTHIQQAAKPLQISTIVEQPQVAVHHQIQASISSQQPLQIVCSSNITSNTTSSNGGNCGGGVQTQPPSSSLVKSLLANMVTSSSPATAISTSATTNANANVLAAVVIDTNAKASAALSTPQSCLITQSVNLHQVTPQ